MNKYRPYIICFLVLGAGCTLAHPGTAAPVQDIRSAQNLMEQNAPEEARDQLRELLIDYPESAEVRFGIGCAWFLLGEQRIAENKVEEAETAYQEALTSFDALLHDENTAVARESAFNRANCLLRKASMIDSTQNYGEAVAALRLAVEAYETGAEKYPDHEGIRSNLVHTRFQLKQLLQNPAEQEEQPEQQPPPTLVSIFNNVKTEVPGANAAYEDNTAILTMPGNKETKP